ncbi:response regulator [Ruminococcaceae bacterium OttesenSCG-928-L11]|nr:response regulator [Ruminococcaceae bacterium OttesenSCG-928-L11]
MKLLIVDDETAIREGLVCMLDEDYGSAMEIESAASGFEGIEKALAFLPDIVLVDVNMPMMDGLSMISSLREQGFSGHFIVLTGFDDYNYAVRALRLRVFDYLLKPVDQDALYRLLDQIRETLPGQNSAAGRGEAINLKKVSRNIRAVLTYIEQNYSQIQSVEQIAQHVHLHPNYVNALFRKETGLPINQYINQFRVERAKELLLGDDDATVETVAEAVGFQTTRNFYKVFKQTLGISPGQFRKDIEHKEYDSGSVHGAACH